MDKLERLILHKINSTVIAARMCGMQKRNVKSLKEWKNLEYRINILRAKRKVFYEILQDIRKMEK